MRDLKVVNELFYTATGVFPLVSKAAKKSLPKMREIPSMLKCVDVKLLNLT